MALRGTASQANSSASQDCIVNVSGIGILANDVILAQFTSGGSATATLTYPTGFSAISGLSNHANATSSTDTSGIAYKIAGASEPTSYTFHSSQNDFLSATVRVYSGRSGLFTATQQTNVSSGAVPLTINATGLTAAAGDDLVLMLGGAQDTAASGKTYTYTAPSGWTNSLINYTPTQFSPVNASADLLNVSAGATGTITSSMTNNAAQNYACTCYLMTLAVSSFPYPPMALGGMNVQVCQ